MKSRRYSTTEIAKQVGVHANTVRLYEKWGFLPPVARGDNGYRLFTEAHLDQMRLARLTLHGGWPGPSIRRSALELVRIAATGDLDRALAHARHHLILVQAEQAEAEAAAALVQHWATGGDSPAASNPIPIREAARSLEITVDMVRNWERNGLIRAPRDPANGYRQYGPAEIGRLRVIRMLRLSGYSTMAILRMLLLLDQGHTGDLRLALDTPRPDEDVMTAADRWLSTLAEQEQRARRIIALVEEIIRKRP